MRNAKPSRQSITAFLIVASAFVGNCSTDPAFDVVEKEPNADVVRYKEKPVEQGRLEVTPEIAQETPAETSEQPATESPVGPSLPEGPSTGPVETEPEVSIPAEITDRFVQNDLSKLDILWVIDNSGSMAEIQTQIRRNFRQFAEMMRTSGIDLQMAVTTTDICSGKSELLEAEVCPTYRGAAGLQGRLARLNNGISIVHSSSPSMVEDFARLSQVGITGSSFEHGLSATRMAVARMVESSDASLLRPDAYLAIMIVSDEQDDGVGLSMPDERGVNYRAQGLTKYYYDAETAVMDLRQLLPGGRFSLNAITGTKNTNGEMCSYLVGNKYVRPVEEGSQYLKAASLSGGLAESICDSSWAAKFERMAKDINQQIRSFKLSKPAEPNSIRVLVNDENSTAWTYDSQSLTIEFAENQIPDFGSQIEVFYNERTLP